MASHSDRDRRCAHDNAPGHCPACVSEELASLEHAAIVYVAPGGTMKLFRLEEEKAILAFLEEKAKLGIDNDHE